MVFFYLFTLHLLGFGRSHPSAILKPHALSNLTDCHFLEGKKEHVLYSPVSLAHSVES